MGIVTGVTNSRQSRANHWNEIRSRVRTHEGELLSGTKARSYVEKFGKRYLGKDLSGMRPIDERRVEQFEKTGR